MNQDERNKMAPAAAQLMCDLLEVTVRLVRTEADGSRFHKRFLTIADAK
jgi:hypothetical protein